MRGWDCGRDARRGPGLRRCCGGATVEEQSWAPEEPQRARTLASRAFRRRGALRRDGATPERRGPIARSCRDMPQRALLLLPCSGSSVPRTEGQGRWPRRSNSPGGSPALVRAGGASVVPGSAVSACGPAAPGAAPRETRGSGR